MNHNESETKWDCSALIKGGIITSIVGCVITVLLVFAAFSYLLTAKSHIFFIVFCFFALVFDIVTLIFCCKALSNPKFKTISGILSILMIFNIIILSWFISFVGGIVTLCGKLVKKEPEIEDAQYRQIYQEDY